jgi:hypothetical protein
MVRQVNKNFLKYITKKCQDVWINMSLLHVTEPIASGIFVELSLFS